MHHNDLIRRGAEKEVEKRPNEALTIGGDKMTPGELTGKWENRE